jgi:hypothetical protein
MRIHQPKNWRVWLRILQVVVTLSLIVFLFTGIQWSEVRDTLYSLQWNYFSLAAFLFLLIHLVNVYRWQWLVNSPTPNYAQLICMYGAGLFANNFLPTGVGGDGIRAALLSRFIAVPKAVLSVALDRGIGVLTLFIFLFPALLSGDPPFFMQNWLALQTNIFTVGKWLFAVFLISLFFLWFIRSYACSVAKTLVKYVGGRSFNTATLFSGSKTGLAGVLCSIVSITLLILSNHFVLMSLGIETNISIAIWLVICSSLSLLAPISVNGLGVFESVYVIILSSYGISHSSALSVALLIRLLTLLFSLLGGIISLWAKYTHQTDSTSQFQAKSS